MTYKWILFDADETLFDFKKAERNAFEKTMLDTGFEYDEAYHFPLYKEVNTAIWKELEEGLITQKKLKVERFRRFLKRMESSFDPVVFAEKYMAFLGEGSYLFDESMALIQKLHSHYQLMIITNGLSKVQDKRIRKSVIAPYFEAIVVSEEVGIAKPDPRIFEHALASDEALDKNRILMVGDNLKSDILGGINYGIDTCWYNPKAVKNIEAYQPTYEIGSLMELLDIV